MLTPPQAGAVWPLPTSVARVPGLPFPAASLDLVSRGLTFQPDQLKGLGRAPSTLSSLFLSFPPSLLSSRPQEATLRGADPSVSPAFSRCPFVTQPLRSGRCWRPPLLTRGCSSRLPRPRQVAASGARRACTVLLSPTLSVASVFHSISFAFPTTQRKTSLSCSIIASNNVSVVCGHTCMYVYVYSCPTQHLSSPVTPSSRARPPAPALASRHGVCSPTGEAVANNCISLCSTFLL